MTVTLLDEEFVGEQTSFSSDFDEVLVSGSPAFVQERKHSRRFFWETNNHDDSTAQILNDAITLFSAGPVNFPLWGSTHPDDPDATLVAYEVSREADSGNHGRIECKYEFFTDPLTIPAKVLWSSGSQERIFEGAYAFIDPTDLSEDTPGLLGGHYPDLDPTDFYPITNSAYYPYIPPPVDQDYYQIITVNTNFALADWNPKTFLDNFVRRVNSADYVIKGVTYTPGTVFLAEPPRGEEDFDKHTAVRYVKSTWTFWLRTRGWLLVLPDLGFRELVIADDPDGGDRPIFALGGGPVQEAVKLDGSGQRAAVGDPTVWLSYRVRKTADFNDLGLFS